jgi:hypothetical protein
VWDQAGKTAKWLACPEGRFGKVAAGCRSKKISRFGVSGEAWMTRTLPTPLGVALGSAVPGGIVGPAVRVGIGVLVTASVAVGMGVGVRVKTGVAVTTMIVGVALTVILTPTFAPNRTASKIRINPRQEILFITSPPKHYLSPTITPSFTA